MNWAIRRSVSGDDRPVFYDIETTSPQLREFDENYEAIRAEIVPLLDRRDDMPRYHELDPLQKFISAGSAERWNVFMFYSVGKPFEENLKACPKIAEILGRVPNLFQAFVSILDPKKSIPAHEGPYLGYLRYHLGIKIPQNNPPSIRVRDQIHTWEEGESILFDDSWEHEVTNNSDSDRAVLIVDIFRPLPFHLDLMNRAYTKVFGRRYAKKVAARADRFKPAAQTGS